MRYTKKQLQSCSNYDGDDDNNNNNNNNSCRNMLQKTALLGAARILRKLLES